MSTYTLERTTTSPASSTATQVTSGRVTEVEMPTRTTTAAGATSQVKEIPSPPVAGLPAGPLGHGWELGQFLPLDGELDEDGTHVVSDAMLLMYGSGQSWPEALQDYISSLIDYYRLVQQGADQGSDKDRRELERIHGYLHPVSH